MAPSTPVRARHSSSSTTGGAAHAPGAASPADPSTASATHSPLRLTPRRPGTAAAVAASVLGRRTRMQSSSSTSTPSVGSTTVLPVVGLGIDRPGLSVSHELELDDGSASDDGSDGGGCQGLHECDEPADEHGSKDGAVSNAGSGDGGGDAFELSSLAPPPRSATSKGKDKAREAYGAAGAGGGTGTPTGAGRGGRWMAEGGGLLGRDERLELERLRTLVGRQDSLTPGQSPNMSQPPSFERSEFETIVRRLKTHTQPGSLKRSAKRERMAASQGEGDDDWEFAGWGSVSYIPLPAPPLALAPSAGPPAAAPLLGQFRATSVPGNAVFGSVFYSLPAIVAQSRTLSPLSMLVACAVLALWRGVLVELGGAMRLNGGNYAYLLNVGGKSLGLLGAAVTLLDVVATGTVSAGTAAAYIEGEWPAMPFRSLVLGLLILIVFTLLLLFGVKDSTRLTLSICAFHLVTMALLIVLASATLITTGPAVLKLNWAADLQAWSGSKGAADAVWSGLCVGFLGLTGIECAPTFVEEIKPEAYGKAIRNLMIGALLLNVPLLLLLSLSLEPDVLYTASNLLSLLAETSRYAPRFLEILVVADAVVVLCGGVLCGGVACCSLVDRLSSDGVLPRWVGWKAKWTKDVSLGGVGLYLGICIVFYASAGFSLATLSNIFSISFTSMMLLYALSALLLHLNLPHLPLAGPATHVALPQILLALALVLAILVGNAVLAPVPIGLTAAYAGGIFAVLWVSEQQTAAVLRGLVWLLDRSEGWRFARIGGKPAAEGLDGDEEDGKGRGKTRRAARRWLVRAVRRSKASAVCAWVKDDEISHLIQVVLYTLSNEQTSRLVLIHAYETVEDIPSELQANARLLDEAFPALTIDLKFVAGSFSPSIVKAVASTIDIPLSKHLIGCPSPAMGDLGAFGGARVLRTRGGGMT